MKRFFRLPTLLVTLLTLVLLASLPTAAVVQAAPALDCPAAVLEGAYTFFATPTVTVGPGTVIALPEALLANSPFVLASQGVVSFNDQGQVVLTATRGNAGEAITAKDYLGRYTATTACNIVVRLENGVSFTVRIGRDNTQPSIVSTTPGFVLFDEE
ncbi:MAG: hypothetical protein U0350_31790 [Caldilineaceae bacterium]